MQLFILGKTKSGKSTLASHLEKYNFITYEAGSWARKEFAQQCNVAYDEFSPEYKEQLTAFAMNKLKDDAYYSIKQYESFIQANDTANKLIVGVRNPNDFIHMLRYDSQNVVIFINSHQQHTGSLALFEEGLDIILQYIHFKNKIEQPIPFIEIAEHQLNDNNLIHSLLKEYL